MIVHTVRLNGHTIRTTGRHVSIFVGSAECDARYRDMLVFGRHRWEFYTEGTIDFTDSIKKADCAMIVVTEKTVNDQSVINLISTILERNIPVVGVEMSNRPFVNIPEKLKGKMTKYGWEWFAEFINKVAKKT